MRRFWPFVLLTLLAAAFFWPLVLHPNWVLYSDHSDLLAEHVPAKRFLVRSWQETGEMPLWCPYQFAGSPFVHDIQVAAFYPPHLLLLLLPEEVVAPALSWLVVLHIALAGWLMFAYARHRQMETVPALVAAVGFMFGGRWLMHLLGGGHYILIGMAWLPLLLLCLERGIRGGSARWGTGAGLALALMVLSTQPQWTFYSGLFAAVWSFGYALELSGSEGVLTRRAAITRWLVQGSVAIIWAIALTAIQLLPTMEAAGLSSRALGVNPEGVLSGGVSVVLHLVGPAINSEPFNLQWEDRGGLAVVWLAAAVLAPVFGRGRIRFEAAVCLGMYVFAMGGAILLQPLPGFNLFRQPARMAVVAMFPIAYLAAVTTQALLSSDGLTDSQRSSVRRLLLRIGVVVLLLCGGLTIRLHVQGQPARFHPYWMVLPVTAAGACWLLLGRKGLSTGPRSALWFVMLLVDLWALTEPFVGVREESSVFPRPGYLDVVKPGATDRFRVLDRELEEDGRLLAAPLGSGAPLALLNELEAVRGYSPLDTLRFREFLQFIGNKDAPLRALDGVYTSPMLGNFRLVNFSLLDLLGVRYVIVPYEMPSFAWHHDSRQGPAIVYDFVAGGMRRIAVCSVLYNPSALPRAFLVANALPLPKQGQILATLKSTDFRRVVLLEDFVISEQLRNDDAVQGEVMIRRYEPNRVVLTVHSPAAGYLVLTDVSYPGWVARVDGDETTVYRANYLFRAIAVPAGTHEVVFTFAPASFRIGLTITLIALGTLAVTLVVGDLRRRRGLGR